MEQSNKMDVKTIAALQLLAREALRMRDARNAGVTYVGRPLNELLATATAVLLDARPEFWEFVAELAEGDVGKLQELLQ